MSVRTKKHPTKKIEIIIKDTTVKRFAVPPEKAKGVLVLLSDYKIEDDNDLIDADELFSDLDEKYSRPGAILKGARLKEEFTQVELAQKIGITQANLSKMENGSRPIGKKMAKQLSLVLNIDYRVFL